MSDQPWPPPMLWPDEPLTDGVVLLDRFTEADIPRIIMAATDPATRRWLPLPSPYGEVEAQTFVQSRDKAAASGSELTFAVRGVTDHLLAGALGLSQRGYRHEADVGYWTVPDRRGRGWTARALRLMARYALDTMPLHRIEVITALDNVYSRAVATAAGATFEGIRRNGLPTGTQDAAIYAFIPDDLIATPA